MATYTFKLRMQCSGGEHAELRVTGDRVATFPVTRSEMREAQERIAGMSNEERFLTFLALYQIANNVTDVQMRNAMASALGATVILQ